MLTGCAGTAFFSGILQRRDAAGTIAFPARQQSFSVCSTMYIIEYTVNPENESFSLSLLSPSSSSLFLCLPAYTEACVRLLLGLSRRVSSQPPLRIPVPLASLRSLCLSRNIFLPPSLSRLFPRTRPGSISFPPRSVSPVVATSEFESRRVEGLSRSREKEGTNAE